MGKKHIETCTLEHRPRGYAYRSRPERKDQPRKAYPARLTTTQIVVWDESEEKEIRFSRKTGRGIHYHTKFADWEVVDEDLKRFRGMLATQSEDVNIVTIYYISNLRYASSVVIHTEQARKSAKRYYPIAGNQFSGHFATYFDIDSLEVSESFEELCHHIQQVINRKREAAEEHRSFEMKKADGIQQSLNGYTTGDLKPQERPPRLDISEIEV